MAGSVRSSKRWSKARLPIKKAISNQVRSSRSRSATIISMWTKSHARRTNHYCFFLFFFGHDEYRFCVLGDEVIEWNGQSLNGRSAQEVHDIIADSRYDLQVELIVSRVIAASRRAAQASWRQSHSPTRLHHAGTLKRRQCAPPLSQRNPTLTFVLLSATPTKSNCGFVCVFFRFLLTLLAFVFFMTVAFLCFFFVFFSKSMDCVQYWFLPLSLSLWLRFCCHYNMYNLFFPSLLFWCCFCFNACMLFASFVNIIHPREKKTTKIERAFLFPFLDYILWGFFHLVFDLYVCVHLFFE